MTGVADCSTDNVEESELVGGRRAAGEYCKYEARWQEQELGSGLSTLGCIHLGFVSKYRRT